MKNILLIGVALLLASCTFDPDKNEKLAEPEELRANMPPGLKDCKAYRVYAEGMTMVITRCPNSETTTRSGKYTHATAVEVPVDEDENMP